VTRLRKSSHFLFQLAAVVSLILTISSAYLIHKERDTLSRLLNPGENLKTTEVYSRWLELKTDDPPSWDRVIAWLGMLGYRAVPGAPAHSGEYHAAYPLLAVFSFSFHYPDKDLPAQLLELSFSNQRLDRIEAVAGHALLAEWRLEPKRLAEWSAGSKTAMVQVRVSELSPYVPRAILAIEDKRFFQHGAFDPVGIARASWVDMRHAQLRQGASTISQQLARSIFLDVHRTWRRKALEAALALYLELRYPKPQLLEMYLNQVYWGQDGTDTLLGIESASESLFGKSARVLSVAESATLAGMLQSPHRYSPRAAPAIAEERKKMVLGLMRDQKVITEDQYAAVLREKIHLIPIKKSNEAAYFLATLRDQLSERYALPVLLSAGWKIFTTLDPLLQHEAVLVVSPPAPLPKGEGGRRPGEAPQNALVALDPADGAVLAWVGGTNYQTSPFDRALDAKRQPGSAFKPFVALAALESRKVTSATLLEDKPLTLKGEHGPWSPQNYDRQYRGRVSVADSVIDSRNVPIIRLAMQIGLAPILDVARRAGIVSPLREDLSLALGTSEVTLLELTDAYATLAGGGQRSAPYSIQAILGPDGQILEWHQPLRETVFSPEPVYLVTRMLEAVLDVGTGKSARAMGLAAPAAGKTGTSENFQDAWFIGYTTTLVCGVWVGYDIPRSLGRSAAGIALPLWTAFVKKAVALDPPQAFAEPQGLVWKTIDPDSGLLVRTGCVHRLQVAFLPGTEPTQECTLHAGGIVGFIKRLRAKS
jgi:penicillin-binding protein 1B